ncbi:GntR family transcriptional regulator [Siculibacillus lacustris]|uniref:GntR family transcriptional regulator n=1 Tax=Siculibacillus lacustris TaxID=1549641 RepID=UPI002B057A92|nr:GntR family transcriptional regulator [Siculibacillus lacustris]
MANQILDFVREARLEQGCHLREQQLGDLFGVSRTPIRRALDLLAERGVVEARRNQGFFLLRPFDALHRIEIEVPSSADQRLYERLVNDRIAGIIPESVTQSEIERRYDVDRVVMLRTLARLAEDGLVERNEGRGWTFRSTLDTAVSLQASYDFRIVLEPAAFLLPTFRADPAALERMRRQHLHLVADPDIAAVGNRHLFATDAAFHELFAEFSGNVFLFRAVQQQNRLRRLLEFSGYGDRHRIREWCREHLTIIDAVRAGDLTAAAAAMRAHLGRAHDAAPRLAPTMPSDDRPHGTEVEV